jgi:hypothetical protein
MVLCPLCNAQLFRHFDVDEDRDVLQKLNRTDCHRDIIDVVEGQEVEAFMCVCVCVCVCAKGG